MEERAAPWTGTRRPLIAGVRKGDDGGEHAVDRDRPVLFAAAAGASPARDTVFERFDPRRFAAAAAEAGIDGLAVITEPDFFRGDAAWIEAARGESDAPLLRVDWLLDPPSVFDALADPLDAVTLHAELLGDGGLDETLAFLREQAVTGVLVLEDLKDVETAYAHNPPAVIIERIDRETLEIRRGFADRVLDLLGDYPGLRFLSGGIDSAAAVRAAGERPVQGILLSEFLGAAKSPEALFREMKEVLGA